MLCLGREDEDTLRLAVRFTSLQAVSSAALGGTDMRWSSNTCSTDGAELYACRRCGVSKWFNVSSYSHPNTLHRCHGGMAYMNKVHEAPHAPDGINDGRPSAWWRNE